MTEDKAQYLVERVHSAFGFSKLPLLDLCPGFANRPGPAGPAAERGTHLGEVVADWVVGGFRKDAPLPEHDVAAVSYAREILQDWDRPGYQWHAEMQLHTSITDVWGYADLVGLDTDGESEVVLVELKTGWSERPRAWRNPQVMGLALALLELGTPMVTALLVEMDKRSQSIALWDQTDIPFLRSRLASIVDAAREPAESALEPGEYCAWCGRNGYCSAFAAIPQKAMVALRRPLLPPADWAGGLSPESVAEILDRAMPVVELAVDYLGALKARAVSLLDAGAEVPGWRIKTSAGPRAWDDAEKAQDALEALIGPAALTLKSPAQIEAVAKAAGLKKEIEAIIAQHAHSTERRSLTRDRSK